MIVQKASYWQNNGIKRQNYGLLYRSDKWARNIFETSDENHWLTRIKIWKIVNYSKLSFLWTKKPPFDKTTCSNGKTEISCIDQISGLERFLKLLTKNHGLTRYKICKFFDYSIMSFLWTKKPPVDKTTWSSDKTKVFWTEK